MENKSLISPIVLGISHGIVDAATGMAAGYLFYTAKYSQVIFLIMLYNILAFLLQPLAGIVTDRRACPGMSALSGLITIAGGLLLVVSWPMPAVVLLGIGSSFFHVGGGSLSFKSTPGRATGPGIFTGPGVFGAGTGLALGMGGFWNPWIFLFLLAASGILVLKFSRIPHEKDGLSSSFSAYRMKHSNSAVLGIILLLTLSIAFRSYTWTGFQVLLPDNLSFVMIMGAVAALGKISGGFLADRLGWQIWGTSVLAGAALLLPFGQTFLLLSVFGLGLMQSATPVAFTATARMMPAFPATAAGLASGTAIALGGIPMHLGFIFRFSSPYISMIIVLFSALFLWGALLYSSYIFRRNR